MLSTLGHPAELYDSAETFLARVGESAATAASHSCASRFSGMSSPRR